MKLLLMILALLSIQTAAADEFEINSLNLMCEVNEGAIINDKRVYWARAIYINDRGVYFSKKFGVKSFIEAQKDCDVIDELLILAEQSGGVLDVKYEEETLRRQYCYRESEGGVYRGYPTGRVICDGYVVDTRKEYFFPKGLTFSKKRHYREN